MLHRLILFDCVDHSIENVSNQTVAPSFGWRRTLRAQQVVGFQSGHQFVDAFEVFIEAGFLRREEKGLKRLVYRGTCLDDGYLDDAIEYGGL